MSELIGKPRSLDVRQWRVVTKRDGTVLVYEHGLIGQGSVWRQQRGWNWSLDLPRKVNFPQRIGTDRRSDAVERVVEQVLRFYRSESEEASQ